MSDQTQVMLMENATLKDLPRMTGSDGYDDYTEVHHDNEIRIGIKMEVQAPFLGHPYILCRFRIMASTKPDAATIVSVGHWFNEKFGEEAQPHKAVCQAFSDNGTDRVSFAYNSDNLFRHGTDPSIHLEQMQAGFTQDWREIAKKVYALIDFITGNSESNAAVKTVLDALYDVFLPQPLPDSTEPENATKADVVSFPGAQPNDDGDATEGEDDGPFKGDDQVS